MSNIATALIKAKMAFGPVLKVKNNPAFKAKYARLEDCLDAVDDACLANGIALYQETFEAQGGVMVETVFLHSSGESLRCGKLFVPAQKQDPQGYGSALTYARRYSLLSACGIAAEDDDGQSATRPLANKADPDRAAWIAEHKSLIAAAKTAGDLKRVVADAVAFAESIGDHDAAAQVTEAAQAKIAARKSPDAQPSA